MAAALQPATSRFVLSMSAVLSLCLCLGPALHELTKGVDD